MTQYAHIHNYPHNQLPDTELISKIKHHKIAFGGNGKLKIYGTLHCKSGKRLKKENRVFFASEVVAIQNNFRPCGHCLKTQYQQWIYSARNPTKT